MSRDTAHAAPVPPAALEDEAEAPSTASTSSVWETIYRQHADWLIRKLARRVGADRAQDLSQDVFLRLQTYREGAVRSPKALLATIARRVRARDLQKPDGAATPQVARELPIHAEQEHRLALKEALLALPPKLQDVFILHRFEGLTYPEIARRLGISIKTVEWRMSKALDICAARLRD